MSVGRKKLSVCQNNVTAFSCCGKGIECFPGWQLCRNCYSKQYQILEKNNDILEEEANITEIESEFMKDSLRHQLNGSLEAIGESPVKTHGMPKYRRL